MASEHLIPIIKERWHIGFKQWRTDLPIQGSPERTLFRAVFEDDSGQYFLLEQVGATQRRHKQGIIGTLDRLHQQGLHAINPYFKTAAGESLVAADGFFWQLSRFINGTPLPRPDYLNDGPKGEALAAFLIALGGCAGGALDQHQYSTFSLKDYVLKMAQDMAVHDPEVLAQVAPVLALLERRFMAAYDDLPVSFCHGDYHPLNIIWNGHEILAVIDWEFLGTKPEIYDAANLIGCLGMEHPRGLNAALARSFMRAMKAQAAIRPESWALFPEFVMALRFAWLAEWLRKKDAPMIDLEITYLKILLDNIDALREIW